MAPDGSSLEIELGRRDEGGGSGGVPLGTREPHLLEPSRTSIGVSQDATQLPSLPAMEGGLRIRGFLACKLAVDQTLYEHPPGQGCVSLPGISVFSRDTLNVIFGKLEA